MSDSAAYPLEELALVDGERMPLAEARLAVTDDGVARGDGAFETIGVWDGRPFRVDDHLERLTHSLGSLGLPAPPVEVLREEIDSLCAGLATDAAVRVYVTGSGTRVATLSAQPRRLPPRRLVAQPAPWIRPLGTYGPAGAKTMSYAPNMAASRAAVRDGGDDALLVSADGLVLEGPTFCVLWVQSDRVCTPDPALGIVDSISRRTLLALAEAEGLATREGRWRMEDVAAASEVFVCSSVRPVVSIEAVGDVRFDGEAPVARRLDKLLDGRRRERG